MSTDAQISSCGTYEISVIVDNVVENNDISVEICGKHLVPIQNTKETRLLKQSAGLGRHRIFGFYRIDSPTTISGKILSQNVTICCLYIDALPTLLKPGLALLIRCKNEEKTIRQCIECVVDLVDELIYVDNNSTDESLQIVRNIAKTRKNIVIAEYPLSVPRIGAEQEAATRECLGLAKTGNEYLLRTPHNYFDNAYFGNTLAMFYNFTLRRASVYNVMLWDADMIVQRDNFIEMISKNDLQMRSDQFSLWSTGQTVFVDSAYENFWLKTQSFYDQNRAFSKLHNFCFCDTKNWEGHSPGYMRNSRNLRFEKPVFFELRPLDKVLNRAVIDGRDVEDHQICEKLAANSTAQNVTLLTKNLLK